SASDVTVPKHHRNRLHSNFILTDTDEESAGLLLASASLFRRATCRGCGLAATPRDSMLALPGLSLALNIAPSQRFEEYAYGQNDDSITGSSRQLWLKAIGH